jgi:hypothetical protein
VYRIGLVDYSYSTLCARQERSGLRVQSHCFVYAIFVHVPLGVNQGSGLNFEISPMCYELRKNSKNWRNNIEMLLGQSVSKFGLG